MDNQEIIEKIYKLQMLLKGRNGAIVSALERSTIPLIEYNNQIASLSKDELLEIGGVGDVTADLIMRIIKGEHVYDIAKSVPKLKRREKWEIEAGASSRI